MTDEEILQDEIYKFLCRIGYKYSQDELADRLQKIFSNENKIKALLHVATKNRITGTDLIENGMKEATAYNTIKALRRLKMIEVNRIIRSKRDGKGGPPTTEYRRVISQRWFPTLYKEPPLAGESQHE